MKEWVQEGRMRRHSDRWKERPNCKYQRFQFCERYEPMLFAPDVESV